MKTRTTIGIAAGFLLAGAAGINFLVQRTVESRIGPRHVFELSEKPRFLSEELALAAARDTLARDGYDAATWQPTRDSRTTAPDGRPDEFMARNTEAPNRGVIAFRSGAKAPRFVAVELEDGRLVCRTSKGK